MTLKQMEYVIMVAKCASLSDAAKQLFISQPSLSEAIKKLEDELGIKMFIRERTGVSLTEAGEEFLQSAQSIINQVNTIERKYERADASTRNIAISSIHYFFMGDVLAEVVKAVEKQGFEAYEIRLIDEGTLEVINDVVEGISEIGIISYTDHNRAYIMKELKKYDLDCYDIISTPMKVFMGKNHPMADYEKVNLIELKKYPYASVWQNTSKQFYFTEEGIFLPANQKRIYVRDSGTARIILRETEAFAMGTGVLSETAEESEICMVELTDAPILSVSWIRKSGHMISEGAKEFLGICANKLGNEQIFSFKNN